MKHSSSIDTVVFGGGCFWCTEAIFQRLVGVISVRPGYAGGHNPKPTYEDVSSQTTGHAEVIEVKFDVSKISFRDLLEVFFATHNPCTKNQQGNDIGEQYRSIILYTTPQQRDEALAFINGLIKDKVFEGEIVTEVEKLEQFFEAENYHQNYYNQNSNQPYCQAVINPKLAKFREKFAKLIKE